MSIAQLRIFTIYEFKMKNYKILLADSNHPVLEETLKNAGIAYDAAWNKSAEALIKDLPNYNGLIIRSKFKVTKEIIDSCPNLKCIGRVGAGMENIDVAYAKQKGITCLSVPEGNRDAVGEHAVGMLLMLLNNIKKADEEVRNGKWVRAENRGKELKHMTVALIGYGYMGSAMAEKLTGFGCEILVYDKYKTGFGDKRITESNLPEIFRKADVLSLHLPLNDETKYMVNKQFIDSFAKPIYIVNTARGKNLKTEDLVDALESGKVLGACLDVLEYEAVSFEALDATTLPKPFAYLLTSDKVILTPHIAGWTHDSNYKMSKWIAEKMVKCIE